ncbi:uncharacterized protein BDZ99DRAFT_259573 [Mytilinidion resinicola]|uniref:ABM domain-containing protein n=1 Tax=Mytilinidion resinicola TaxID=574789 RepID=A0A6A6YXR4_9PEZI|nr:uncharacterized protein BDZ99DRAFT_259573 [Mytilinidion resinicola]KAF2813621.1 hypothetical protein BDZ99DRAFT_259573 [Mytilinidion resinicola]
MTVASYFFIMTSTIHLTTFEANSAEDREKVVTILTPLQPHAVSAGLSKFCICIPDDPADATPVLLIEEIPPSPISTWASDGYNPSNLTLNSVLETLSTIQPTQKLLPGVSFYRPSLATTPVEDLFIVTAMFGFRPGTALRALQGWREFAGYCEEEEEEDVLGYYVAAVEAGIQEEEKAAGEGEEIRTLEIYASKKFVYDVHLKSPAVGRNQEQNGAWRNGRRGVGRWRVVGGSLG